MEVRYSVKEIKVKYIHDIDKLEKIEQGNWIDLRVSEHTHMSSGEFRLLPLGIAMELPKGYEAHVVPRSSTFGNWGVIQTNSFGVIDESYNGDNDMWKFPALATRDVFIPKGTRICQFRIVPVMEDVGFVTVDSLENEDRNGFGSTGVD